MLDPKHGQLENVGNCVPSGQLANSVIENSLVEFDDPFSALYMQSDRSLDEIVDAVVAWARLEFGEQQLIHAKEEFFWKMGKVFYDDPFFDTRMSYFLDFFLFERPLDSTACHSVSLTPFQAFLDSSIFFNGKFDPNFMRQCFDIGATKHTLLEIMTSSPIEITVCDLVERKKLKLTPRTGMTFEGLKKKAIIQGFLTPFGRRVYLGRGVLFHEKEVSPIIKANVKRLSKLDRPDYMALLGDLAVRQLRFLRQRKVDIKSLYS